MLFGFSIARIVMLLHQRGGEAAELARLCQGLPCGNGFPTVIGDKRVQGFREPHRVRSDIGIGLGKISGALGGRGFDIEARCRGEGFPDRRGHQKIPDFCGF